jgi:amino acid permease
MGGDGLFSRDEVLGGLPARRAHTILFLVESRVAHLVSSARRATELRVGEKAGRERDLAFVEAFTLGREPPLRPTIHHLERYAAQWADLVPDNPRLRAAVAHVLGEKYRFTPRTAPAIATTLGVDTEPVRRAYQRLYRAPIESIFAAHLSPLQQLQWVQSRLSQRLETLPPFWTVFSLTLTETVGAGILAIPIAAAAIGPIPALILLLLLGFISTLTLAALAEAFARNGQAWYENVYFGRLAHDYLGKRGSLVPTVAIALMAVVILEAYYVGVSTTIGGLLPVPSVVVAALLFAIGLYLLSRPSLNSTISTALITGACSIALIVAMSFLGLLHFHPSDLSHVDVPFIGGRPFQAPVLAIVFGVILDAYFGHFSVGNCATLVLRRDPSGRSLIWGAVWAQVVAAALYGTWVLAVNGAIPYQQLQNLTTTSIVPMEKVAGPAIVVFGSIFAVLAMGMGSVHLSLALRNLVGELLPIRSESFITLPTLEGRLLCQLDGPAASGLGISYLGLQRGQPRFRLETELDGRPHRLDTVVTKHWALRDLHARLPSMQTVKANVSLEVLEATDAFARLRVTASEPPAYEGDWTAAAVHPAEMLEMPDPERTLLQWIVRRGSVTLDDAVQRLGEDEPQVQALLRDMVQDGLLREVNDQGKRRYRAQLGRIEGTRLPDRIWDALDGTPEAADPPNGHDARPHAATDWIHKALASESYRFALSVTPIAVIFLVTEWLLTHHEASFAGAIGFVGAAIVPVLGGVYPILLLLASRRKGEHVPRVMFRALGSLPVAITIYTVYLTSILVHSLFIWQNPTERIVALIWAGIVTGMTILAIRRGAFTRRVVVEMREEPPGTANSVFSVVASGQPLEAGVAFVRGDNEESCHAANGEIASFASLHRATFDLPAGDARELEIWVHRETAVGESEMIPCTAEITCDGTVRHYDLPLPGGRSIFPLTGGPCSVTIELAQRAVAEPVIT